MSSAPLKDLLASTSFRLSLVCAAVIVLAFALSGLGLWFVTRSAAEHAARERIGLEMQVLQNEIRDEGMSAAIAAIQSRQHAPGALEYQLTGPDGGALAGNLELEAPATGWSLIYLPSAGAKPGPDLVVFAQPVAGGGSLVIAEDLERTEALRYAILRTLFWIAVAALLLSVTAGYLAARGALRQMDGVFATMERVGAGDLAARAPVRSARRKSDIDVLGLRINAMLARIDGLVGNLRRVSTGVAHELRTPLTHVRQQLDEVVAANTLDAARASARTAQFRIDDMMRTFAAMLRLAEIEAGAAQARFVQVELGALIERVADAYRPDIESGGGSLVIDAPVQARIQGDPDLLAQALANLLDNAMAHGPAAAEIAVRLQVDGGAIRIAVEDRGPGVPAAERTRILEPFVRLDRSRNTAGAGLGLSIVSAVARLHGAQLSLGDAQPGLCVELAWAPDAANPTERTSS